MSEYFFIRGYAFSGSHEGPFSGADNLFMTFDEPVTLSWLQWALYAAGEPSNVRQL